MQYANLDADPHDNAIKPGLKIRNTGTVPIDLSRVTLRYWFTADDAKTFEGFCDYADLGCAQGHHRLRTRSSPTRPGADTYLEVGFSGGTVQAGGNSGQIQLRVHGKKFELFDERTTTATARTRPSPPR